MQYISKMTLLHDQLGRLPAGVPFEATDAQIKSLREYVEPYDPTYQTKVVNERPFVPSSVSEEAPALPSQTATPSKRGASRRKTRSAK